MISIAFAWELVKAIVEWASKRQSNSEKKEDNFLFFSEAAWNRFFIISILPLFLHIMTCFFIVIIQMISGSLDVSLLGVLIACVLTWSIYVLYNVYWLKKHKGKAVKVLSILVLCVTVLPFPIVALIC